MKEIYSEIEIDATPDVIWHIITDFASYPHWNPFILSIEGKAVLGSALKVTVAAETEKTMTFLAKCNILKPNKELSWKGHLIFPGIFDGIHMFQLNEIAVGTTRLVHREQFKGILVPFLKNRIKMNTAEGFRQMNEKLKELSELRYKELIQMEIND